MAGILAIPLMINGEPEPRGYSRLKPGSPARRRELILALPILPLNSVRADGRHTGLKQEVVVAGAAGGRACILKRGAYLGLPRVSDGRRPRTQRRERHRRSLFHES